MKRLGNLFHLALRRAGYSVQLDVARIQSVWPQIAGEDASWSTPTELKKGKLVVSVPTGTHLTEAQMRIPEWEAALRRIFPQLKVKEVKAISGLKP